MSTFDLENPTPIPGDALRDDAANLLATKYGRPTREMRVDGKKADLYFSRKIFGKDEKVYLEVKDYDRRLKRDEVVRIWADYSGIIHNNMPAVLVVVTRNGLTADAQAFINEEQAAMRHQTIRELENEVLGLTEYIRALSKLFDQDGLSAYYVAGRARKVTYSAGDEARQLSDDDVEIFEELQTWLGSDDVRPVAILGGYGAGKTSLARRLISAQAKVALANPLARRPVLIRLGDMARYSNLEGVLGGMFTHDFPVDGFNSHHFLDLNEKGRLLIVLDGFDEMKHAMTWPDFRSMIGEFNRLIKGYSKVVLLGRPSAFTSMDEHFHVLRGMKRLNQGWRTMLDWPNFYEYELCEFSAEERAHFVREYLRYLDNNVRVSGSDQRWIDERADEVNRLADIEPEIFGKPVHAKILTDLAADRAVDLGRFSRGVSRWQLYEIFFTSLVEREMKKDARRPIGEEDRLEFLREVAFWLWSTEGGTTAFSCADVPDSLISHLAEGDAPNLDAQKREYLSGAFLEKKGGDIFYFGHRSFAEFLVAERMVKHPPSPKDQGVYSSLARDGVREFLNETPQKDGVRAWVGTLSQAQGTIHVEYLEFLAEVSGGISSLANMLPAESIWRPLLEVFGNEINLTDELCRRAFAAMRKPDNVAFCLLLKLVLLIASSLGRKKPDPYAISTAAALLDRVFETAHVDKLSGKMSIETSGEGARSIASKVLPRVTVDRGERVIVFQGSRLMQAMAETMRRAGVDLGLQAPSEAVILSSDLHIPLFDVLNQMAVRNAKTAREYFQRADDLSWIYSKAYIKTRDHTR